jgi:phosphohistidine phosphatase
MELYFLRHGLAGDRSQWHGDDAARPLTQAGVAQTAREGQALAELGVRPDIILTSPFARACQTAEVLARELGLSEQVIEEKRLRPGFSRKRLRKILAKYDGHDRIMLVGHEPDFSKTIGKLIGCADVAIKKGGLAGVELADPKARQGRLLYMATPEMLERRATMDQEPARAAG